jgi:uncharacterized membrane protein YoaK (UPF0700 family)
MVSLNRRAIVDLLLLSVVAGSADASGYLGLGRVFTANMTGNVVLLGIALGQGHFRESIHSFCTLIIFALGTSFGVWITHGIDRKDWSRLVVRALSGEVVLLSLLALLWSGLLSLPGSIQPSILLFLLAFSMGLQSAVLNLLNLPGMATTAVTSTVTSVVGSVIKLRAISDGTSEEAESLRLRLWFGLLVLFVYCAGAACSGILMIHEPKMVAMIPATLVIIVVLRNGTPDKQSAG